MNATPMRRAHLSFWSIAVLVLFVTALSGARRPPAPSPAAPPEQHEPAAQLAAHAPEASAPYRPAPAERRSAAPTALEPTSFDAGTSAYAESEAPYDEGPEADDALLFDDDTTRIAQAQWLDDTRERADAEPREDRIAQVFDVAGSLEQVECRATLCRVTLRRRALGTALPSAVRLGSTGTVLETSDERVVLLVPVTSVDMLPEA